MNNKRFIFISDATNPLADAGGGAVVIYRHLKRLRTAGYHILIINISNAYLYQNKANREFETIILEKKWWFPPLRRKTPLLTTLRYRLYFYLLKKKITFHYGNDIILGLLGEASNLLAVEINKHFSLPFYLFYHDDTIFNRYFELNVLQTNHIKEILSKASFIFPVSDTLVDLLHSKGIGNAARLYPIPEGFRGVQKDIEKVNILNLQFCASGMIEAIHFNTLKSVGIAVRQINGHLHCISDIDKHSKNELNHFMTTLPRFDSLTQFFTYVNANIDILIVFYSFDSHHEPRMLTSFPSKLLEYCFLGLPILIIAPKISTLGKWAIEHEWLCYTDSDMPERILHEVEKFREPGFWLKCQQQSLKLALHEFDADTIHQTLLRYLNLALSADHASRI
ncbi:MAG: hypothetical protein JWQ66_4432 [Mucilaginibacter sp.]|nr:hypothetical protein [Mucilaginibacter sp.]